MKQTFLLQEVIDDLVNTDKSLSSALIKLKYFGKLIKNQELIDYTENELTGYNGDPKEIPIYRKAIATLYIDMQAYLNRFQGELPIEMIDEPYRSALKYFYIKEGIAAVEKLAKESEGKNSSGEIMIHLPMTKLHVLQEPARQLYKNVYRIDVVGAKLATNSNLVIEIPNAIRTKLLDFVMTIADSFGYSIEIESFNEKNKFNNQTIINQMNTTINNSGDGNTINTGDNNQIKNNVTLYKGDVQRLQKEFENQGIDDEDIKSISDIVTTEEPDTENNRLGPKANSWISSIINKSLNGIGKITTGISANLLATLIKQYYGLEN